MHMHVMDTILATFHPAIQIIRRICPRDASRQCERLYVQLLQQHQIIPFNLEVRGVNIITSTNCYGGSADIHIGRLSGMKVAVKAPRLYQANRTQIMADFINEFMIMDSLGSHPHIVDFLGISSDQGVGPSILTLWMEHGTLANVISFNPPLAYRRRIVEQIVDGMSFLKASNVVHGDLKSSNILIAKDGRACIADFGLAFAESSYPSPLGISALKIAAATILGVFQVPPSFDSTTHAGAGSPRWMAPERLVPDQWGIVSAKATFESDVFGLGMVLYEIFSGNIPFYDHNDNMAMIFIVQGKRPERPISIPDELWGLTTRCWASNPFSRPSIDSVHQDISTPEQRFAKTRVFYVCKESL